MKKVARSNTCSFISAYKHRYHACSNGKRLQRKRNIKKRAVTDKGRIRNKENPGQHQGNKNRRPMPRSVGRWLEGGILLVFRVPLLQAFQI